MVKQYTRRIKSIEIFIGNKSKQLVLNGDCFRLVSAIDKNRILRKNIGYLLLVSSKNANIW